MIPQDAAHSGLKCYDDGKTTGKLLPDCEHDHLLKQKQDDMFWICFNTFILFATGLYCMFFARIFEQFGRMIRLIGKVMFELLIFVLFFAFWQFVFAWMTRISG